MPSFDFVLSNRYRLLSPLGEGGMASVYTASDERLGRRVAVKVLAESLLRDPPFVARFQREAEAAARLTHPHIVSVYDVGQDGDWHYIVMELVNGRNLKDMIVERGRLGVTQSLDVAAQILDGLAYAHQHGLIHRDIKPQNILLTREGTAKLADFGIAKAVEATSATQTAVVLGSAHYLSPEQAAGEDVSPASDLYSMGVVLYEMTTGSLPFDGGNLLSVAAQHLHDQPQPPSTLNPSVPRELDSIVLRAMAKRPEERFLSAGAMQAALQETPHAMPAIEDEEDLGATQTNIAPLVQPSETPTASLRPSVLRHGIWAAFMAAAAVFINWGHVYLPANVGHSLGPDALTVFAALVAACAVITLAIGAVERLAHRYTIDAHAVTVESGLLSRHRDAIPLSAVVNLQLHQTPLVRLFNVGTIMLTTVQIPAQGPVTLRLRDVSHPAEIYDEILRRIGSRRRLELGEALHDDVGV